MENNNNAVVNDEFVIEELPSHEVALLQGCTDMQW